MSARERKALFLDLELTCWEGEPPAGEIPEIIEIGIAELDMETLAVKRTFQCFVKPIRSKVSPYCTALTGITPEKAKSGRPFAEAAASVRKAFGQADWYAWGADDEDLAFAEELHGCGRTLRGRFTNLAMVYRHMAGADRKVGLVDALAAQGLGFDGVQHRAIADALNTARLFRSLASKFR